jgi:hypothetical protein
MNGRLRRWVKRARNRFRPWVLYECDTSLQIVPVTDDIRHDLDMDCLCGPRIYWHDPDDGERYDTPIVSHQALNLKLARRG